MTESRLRTHFARSRPNFQPRTTLWMHKVVEMATSRDFDPYNDSSTTTSRAYGRPRIHTDAIDRTFTLLTN